MWEDTLLGLLGKVERTRLIMVRFEGPTLSP